MRQLRVTLLAGVILLLIAGGVFTIFIFADRNANAVTRQQENFSRMLRDFDIDFNELSSNQRITENEIEMLNALLDNIERRAISVESWLSVLKRRRAIASLHAPSLAAYRACLERALDAYPSSQPIIALAAASLVKNTAINREIEAQLRDWMSFITDSPFNSLRLGLHVILGDFRNPERASVIPANIYSDGTESIGINIAVLRILRNDIRGAASDIHVLLNSASPSVNAYLFAAEYHYDFGDLLRSAEIFSLINDEHALTRQADALYLSGNTEMAMVIWNALIDYDNETSLYNLALNTDDPEQKAAYLEKLVNLDSTSNKESRQFGLILYSRILEYSEAIALLRNSVHFSPEDYPYIDLEICKRHAIDQNLGRKIAETWLLLDRHERNEELYKWAAWHFFFQRSFDESRILLDRLYILKMSGQWINIYNAIQYMNEGNLDRAADILHLIHDEDAPWYVNANLGRIYETTYTPSRAIEQYYTASEKLLSPAGPVNLKTVSRIQSRIARCFRALNRPGEVRRVLNYALELDPSNLTAQMELDRIRN
ncbi:MAG: YugE family protein [Treponema sp.]|nr:YugE family protein [Treponema sp.]